MGKEEKIPILSDSQYKSLFRTSERDNLPNQGHNIQDDPSAHKGNFCDKLFHLFDPKTWVIAIGCVFLGAAQMIGLPIWASSLVASHADVISLAIGGPFLGCIVIFIVAVIRWKAKCFGTSISMYPFYLKETIIFGVLTSFGFVLQAYCGFPSRTPAYIQAPTYMAAVIGAALTRMILRRKVFPKQETVCILGTLLMIGFNFIYFAYSPGYRLELNTIEKTDDNLNDTGALNSTGSNSSAPTETGEQWQALWTFGFAMGHAFHGIALVFLDECLAEKGAHPLVVSMYAQMMTISFIVFLFFFDLIPVFGMASNLDEFREHLQQGGSCLFGLGTDCGQSGWRGWLYMLFTVGAFVAQIYLVSFSGSSLFTILCTSASVPIASLVWTCIGDSGYNILWFPTMSACSFLLFLALWGIFPFALLYQYYNTYATKDLVESA